jgi:uncharacterized protein YceK
MKASFRFMILAAAFALLTGCGDSMSSKEARQKLADLNVEYSAGNFVEHASEGDRTVVDLFLTAGMDPTNPDA